MNKRLTKEEAERLSNVIRLHNWKDIEGKTVDNVIQYGSDETVLAIALVFTDDTYLFVPFSASDGRAESQLGEGQA